MGEKMQGVMHYNATLQHQVLHAVAFAASGFDTTTDPSYPAHTHVISGPHYAYQQQKRHSRVLMLDRAWWGDPDCVSLGWLQHDGTRRFATGDAPRPKPELEPWKTRECTAIILVDYGQDPERIEQIRSDAAQRFTSVKVRWHPASVKNKHPIALDYDLRLADVAIATSGTSVFHALRLGLPSICLDPKNVCAPVCSASIDAELIRPDRSQWLHEMSYKQFNMAEIAAGTAWKLLKDFV